MANIELRRALPLAGATIFMSEACQMSIPVPTPTQELPTPAPIVTESFMPSMSPVIETPTATIVFPSATPEITPSPTEQPTPEPTPTPTPYNVDAIALINEVIIDDTETQTGEIPIISIEELKEDFKSFWNAKASGESLTNGEVLGNYQFADCEVLDEACFEGIMKVMENGDEDSQKDPGLIRLSRIRETASSIVLLIAAADEADNPVVAQETLDFAKKVYAYGLTEIDPEITPENFTRTRQELNAEIVSFEQTFNLTQ